MKKLLFILLILSTGVVYGQLPFPCHSKCQSDYQRLYMKQSTDSLAKIFDAKLKVLEASFDKKLKDSMSSLIPADGKTIVVKDGKFTAVGGGTTDLTPVYDTIAKLDAKLTASNLLLTNSINDVSKRVTTLEGKVTALESWRVTVTAQLITINGAIATIPKTATSTSVSTTQTTTTTILQ